MLGARRADLERERPVRAGRDRRLVLRRGSVRREPIHRERRPGAVVVADAEVRLLATHALRPWLRAAVAERDRDVAARLTGAELRVRGLAHPLAVVAEVARQSDEDALMLHPRDAVRDRTQRECEHTLRRRCSQHERETSRSRQAPQLSRRSSQGRLGEIQRCRATANDVTSFTMRGSPVQVRALQVSVPVFRNWTE